MGADLVYNWDHFHPLYGDPAGSHFECWTTLAAFAAVTSRVELGPLARTVDHISGGRLVLGIEPDMLGRDLARHADDYVALGFSQITLGVSGPKYDLEPVRDWLAWRHEAGRA